MSYPNAASVISIIPILILLILKDSICKLRVLAYTLLKINQKYLSKKQISNKMAEEVKTEAAAAQEPEVAVEPVAAAG